jgi:tRNA (guanine-N7-)-methyltransferase
VRKRKKLSKDELAPYMVELPEAYPFRRADSPSPLPPPPPGERGAIDWEQLFGNANPVEVEVGFGKGLFLLSAGMAHPQVNYFGIEIVRKYQLYATTRVAVRGLSNVKTCCADAKRVLANHVPPGSVRTVHVFFPDPWWKSKHKKRLLFTPEFAAAVRRVLRPGGVLHFVTDVRDYFEMVTALLATIPAFRELPPPVENTPRHDMDYLTNFERKFRREGRPIHRSRYEKVGE